MKIAFYSSGGNDPAASTSVIHSFFPNRADDWEEAARAFPEHEFVIFTTLCGGHMTDLNGREFTKQTKSVRYVVLDSSLSVEEIAERIAKEKPDLAVAFTLGEVFYDWFPVRDSLVKEELEKRGIETIAHSAQLSLDAFEKHRASELLNRHGFLTPNHVFVQGSLFSVQERNPLVTVNIYREYIYSKLRSLTFPVILKPDSGAGTVGVSIAESFEEAVEILEKEKCEEDILIEELIRGENFGIEIFGRKGSYRVLPPINLGTGENGLTDPFLSVKYGPVTDEKYGIRELLDEMEHMAEELGFEGDVELDLIYRDGKWYTIDVNPRFSFLSPAASAMAGSSVVMLYAQMATGDMPKDDPLKTALPVVDFKVPYLSDEEIEALRERHPCIRSIFRFTVEIEGRGPVQYCEIVNGGIADKEELQRQIGELCKTERELIPTQLEEIILKVLEEKL